MTEPMISSAANLQKGRISTMTEYLRPHAGSPEALWSAMPGAFLAAWGREVDRTDDHDLMLCHAALAPFNLEDH